MSEQLMASEATLRDLFAAHIMAGAMTSARGLGDCSEAERKSAIVLACKIVYEAADAMLIARDA